MKKTYSAIIWEPIDTLNGTSVVYNSNEAISDIISHISKMKQSRVVSFLVSNKKIDIELEMNEVFSGVYCYFNLAIGRFIKELIVHNHWSEDEIIYVTDNHSHKSEALFYCPQLTIVEYEKVDQFMLLNGSLMKKVNFENITEIPYFNHRDDFEYINYLKIRIEIHDNCGDAILQIHNLMANENINYSNSLLDIDQLINLFSDKNVSCKYIVMFDKFKSYGVVGFYAVDDKSFRHMILSSEITGYGLECYLAKKLNRRWTFGIIDCRCVPNFLCSNNKKEINLLVRGGCDLEQIIPYVRTDKLNIVREFNIIPFRRDHSVYLMGAAYYTKNEKDKIEQDIPFVTSDTYETQMYSNNVDYIVWSSLMEMTQGLYINHDNSNLVTAYKDYDTPYDFFNDKFEIFNYQESCLFLEKWDYSPHISPEQYKKNLTLIYARLPKKVIFIIVTGADVPILEGEEKNRHHTHIEINLISEEFAKYHERVYLLDVRKFVKTKEDLTNNIRHYKSHIYRKLADELMDLIKKCEEEKVKKNSRGYIVT